MAGARSPAHASAVHRAPAGAKLASLAAGTTALLVVRTPVAVAVGAAVVVAGYAAAGLPVRVALAQVAPLRWVLAAVAVVQVLVAGWSAAVVAAGALVVAVAAAGLVTLTTRVSDLLDVVVRLLGPLRRVGVDPERAGLVLALAVRTVPVLAETARSVAEARRARGLERSARALVVPLVVRTVRQAHLLGEALAARGVDDPLPPSDP